MGHPPLATAEEVSKFLGVPVETLYHWRKQGRGPKGARVGRHLRYRWADVHDWYDEQARAGAA
jgi:excisionase family DNA binding protein